MVYAARSRDQLPQDISLDVVQHLWRTKAKGIGLIEKWSASTTDMEIKAGLKMQLNDERRHLRLLGNELQRLGVRARDVEPDQLLDRAFELVQTQTEDSFKLSAYYHGVQGYTVSRCQRLLSAIEDVSARTVEQILRDEQTHIRWAEIRLARRVKELDERRRIEFLLTRVQNAMEAAWSRSWKQTPPTGRPKLRLA